jgi:hypothetical protein
MRPRSRTSLAATLAIASTAVAVLGAVPAHATASPKGDSGKSWSAGPVTPCPVIPFLTGELLRIDGDGDRIRDTWEMTWGLDHKNPCDALLDEDRDGLTNLAEYRHSTVPYAKDSDNDGLKDGFEVKATRTNPNSQDSDRDGLKDRAEVKRYGTNPNEVDSDNDRLRDADEVKRGTDPRNWDSDGDEVSDGREVEFGTDPRNPDTDGDGVDDYTELFVAYTDPTQPPTAPAA